MAITQLFFQVIAAFVFYIHSIHSGLKLSQKGLTFYIGTSRALKYVTGYVLGHSFSGVQGYVWNHRFYGSIYVRNSVLFVEPIVSNNQIRFPYYVPSARRTVRKKGSLNAYVYKIYSRKMKRRKKNKKVRVWFSNFEYSWIILISEL